MTQTPTTAPQTTQEEINAILWQACDTFRGTVDASEYKNYLLVMLFVKYISDVWKEKVETITEQYDGDAERIQRRLSQERFPIPEGATFDELYAKRNVDNLGEEINKALDSIEEQNKTKLEGVFRNIDFNSESNLGQTSQRNTRLKMLLDDFNNPKLDLRPSRVGNQDVIGNAYEYLIANFAAGAGKKAGEFYTPAEVSELIAKLVAPQEGERIYDPTCGSASLLIKCADYIREEHKDSNNFSLFGQEVNGSTWALAKMNMFLHEADSARIEWGDTIREPKLLENDKLMKFNVVVANPPFSLDKWGLDDVQSDVHERFSRGFPPKSKGDFAFISHMIESTHLTENARVGVVVPHGVLFRGAGEGKIRQKLIEENLLDTVIGLPSSIFFGTTIPSAILIFKHGRKDNETVLFIDASRDFGSATNQNILRKEDIAKIVSCYQDRQTIDKYSYAANFKEIEENDFNLNITRYVDTFVEEVEIDILSTQIEIKQLEQELENISIEMKTHLEELGFYE